MATPAFSAFARTSLLIAFCASAAFGAGAASGDEPLAAGRLSTFTNHAGHAVSGRLEAVSDGAAVISGRKYPLSIFPDSEKRRMLDAFPGGRESPRALPAALEAKRRWLKEKYYRNEALARAGAKSETEAAEQRTRILRFWRMALDGAAGLSPEERTYWSSRLLD